MRKTKSTKNIEKAIELYKLTRQIERLSKRLKPLRAHFRDLLDPDDLTLIAGRLAVVGKKIPRATVDKETLKTMITEDQFKSLLTDTSYVEIDVKPAQQVERQKAEA